MTWEECLPLEIEVPMVVAQMECVDTPVKYVDYENTTATYMADTKDCTVDSRVVCRPVISKKCADVTYDRCEEVTRREYYRQ